MGKIIVRHSKHDKGNYTSMSKEITNIKGKNGKPVALEVIGLLFRLLSLPKSWDFSIRGIAKVFGCSVDKIVNHLKTLKELGYFEEIENHDKNGRFTKSTYYINETADSSLWVSEEKPSMENPYMDKPSAEKPSQYKKHKEYKKQKEKKKEKEETSFTLKEKVEQEIEYLKDEDGNEIIF